MCYTPPHMAGDTTSLRGLSVLVTGSASGIGRQLAEDLYLKENCRVILLDRDEQGLKSFCQELRRKKLPQHFIGIPCDLSSKRGIESAVQRVNTPIDVLINNAGITHNSAFEVMSEKDFDSIISVNLLG